MFSLAKFFPIYRRNVADVDRSDEYIKVKRTILICFAIVTTSSIAGMGLCIAIGLYAPPALEGLDGFFLMYPYPEDNMFTTEFFMISLSLMYFYGHIRSNHLINKAIDKGFSPENFENTVKLQLWIVCFVSAASVLVMIDVLLHLPR